MFSVLFDLDFEVRSKIRMTCYGRLQSIDCGTARLMPLIIKLAVTGYFLAIPKLFVPDFITVSLWMIG